MKREQSHLSSAKLLRRSQLLGGKAKITGQIVDRAEVGQPGEFEQMTEDQLRQYIARNLAGLGLSVQPSSGRSAPAQLATPILPLVP